MAYPPSTVAADKTSATPIDTGDDHANHHNAVAAAVNDVVTELGTGPKGGSADLTARLSALDTTVAGKQPLATVLTNTTASFTTADETKLDHLTVTQAVDLDAIETRVNALDAAVVLKGSWDASAGTFPGGGSAQAGESWIVSVGGTVDSVVFVANDRVIAITDNASTTVFASNWFKADYTDAVLSVDGLTGAVSLSSSYQPLDADLTDLAGIADAQGDIIVRGASGWERLAKSATATHVLTAGASQPGWSAPAAGGPDATFWYSNQRFFR